MGFEKTLIHRLSNVAIRSSEHDARYLASYKLYLDFFNKRIGATNLPLKEAKLGVILVYTWMGPAKFNPACWRHFAAAKRALQNAAKGSKDVNAKQIEAIKAFVGNSLIATSKFLHFLEPHRYAIWDSNVAWAAYRLRKPAQYNDIERYLEYLNDLRNLSLPLNTAERVKTAIGKVGLMRSREFALFHLGIAERKQ